MSVLSIIKTTALSVCFLGIVLPAAHARGLTPEERTVCAGLKACLDIVRRHDASEFDYNVLEVEFRRFGPDGKKALFTLLDSDDGQADIAALISDLGPLTPQDRQRIRSKWTQDKAGTYLPLLLDGHAFSRDLLLQSFGHPNADVREKVRTALSQLPQAVRRAPVPSALREPLLSALIQDPIAEAAPYLARLNPAGFEEQFAQLLRSGDSDIAAAAYTALYRENPAQAFNTLLAEMENFETPAQSRAIGNMLASRHKMRQDGFYLQFARDMSGDPKLSAPARASGLHGLIAIAGGPFPELSPARQEALSFLVKGQPRVVQDQYFPYLTAAGADTALEFIWGVAQAEKWVNRDRISYFYARRRSYDKVITGLLQSNDARTFLAGLRRARPTDERLIRAKIEDPVRAISGAARKKLKLPPVRTPTQKCPIRKFDLDDMRTQMPFFDDGWMVADDRARVALSRSYLKTAHPTSTGWLAGYDLKKPGSQLGHSGGSVLHYDNNSGGFETVGDFAGPLAVLPGRPLQLGQTTKQFWVIDNNGDSAELSAYLLALMGRTPRITHVGIMPESAKDFSVNPNGDLLMAFEDKDQAPIRLSKTGKMSLACGTTQPSSTPPALR